MFCNSTFPSLVSIPIGITSSAIALKICVITAGIKKCKLIIKEKKKKHDKIVLLSKSNSTEVLLFQALSDLNSHEEFAYINSLLKELWYEGRNWKLECYVYKTM